MRDSVRVSKSKMLHPLMVLNKQLKPYKTTTKTVVQLKKTIRTFITLALMVVYYYKIMIKKRFKRRR